jgi:hypothetical protein
LFDRKHLHDLLGSERTTGEWFNISPKKIVPVIMLAYSRLRSHFDEQETESYKGFHKWRRICERDSAIIGKFIEQTPMGWEMYEEFRDEANLKYYPKGVESQ